MEEFKEEDRDTVSKLAYILNNFMEEVVNMSQNRINDDNLAQERVTFKATVDASGTPNRTIRFSTSKVANAIDGTVVYARNFSSPVVFPTGGVFVTFNPVSSNLFEVVNIAGLPANKEFTIGLRIYQK